MSDERDVSLGEVYRLCLSIKKKVDETNGQVNDHGHRIAVLEDRGAQATKDPTARNTGLGAIVAAAGALIWQWVKG
jgi:hypothetical protein